MSVSTVVMLAEVPLFNGLPEDELSRVSSISISKKVKKGAMIFSEGDEANGFYVVVHGAVKVFKMSPDGKEKILHIFGPTEPFGEVPVFTGKRFPAYAQAIEKGELLFFPREAFVGLITDNPSLGLSMLAVLSARLRLFADQIENLSLKEVPARLASYLLTLTDGHDQHNEVTLSISKGQLAGILGTIPETLSRIFARMVRQELIRVKGRRIVLIDMESIEALAENGKLLD